MKKNVLKAVFLLIFLSNIKSLFAMEGSLVSKYPDSFTESMQNMLNIKSCVENIVHFTAMHSNTPDFFTLKITHKGLAPKIIVIGDIHANAKALQDAYDSLIKKGLLSQDKILRKNIYVVFMGDFCDRGSNDVKTLNLIFELYFNNPHRVYLCSGNHEDVGVMNMYSALGNRILRYTNDYYSSVTNLSIKSLLENFHKKLASAIFFECEGKVIMFCHGAIPNSDFVETIMPEVEKGLKSINSVIAEQLKWNDFYCSANLQLSNRTVRSRRGDEYYEIGKDVLQKFIAKHPKVKMIFHGHDHCDTGFSIDYPGIFKTMLSYDGEKFNSYCIIDLNDGFVNCYSKPVSSSEDYQLSSRNKLDEIKVEEQEKPKEEQKQHMGVQPESVEEQQIQAPIDVHSVGVLVPVCPEVFRFISEYSSYAPSSSQRDKVFVNRTVPSTSSPQSERYSPEIDTHVTRLQSCHQDLTGALDCGLYALYNANSMLGHNMQKVNSDILSIEIILEKIGLWKDILAGVPRRTDDISGYDMDIIHAKETEMEIVFLKANKITIIDSPEQLQRIQLRGFNPLVIDGNLAENIRDFRLNGNPFAVVLNLGGHWVAYAARKDNGIIRIYHADSIANSFIQNYDDRGLGLMFYNWVTRPEFAHIGRVNPAVLEELNRLESLSNNGNLYNSEALYLNFLNVLTDFITSKREAIGFLNFEDKARVINLIKIATQNYTQNYNDFFQEFVTSYNQERQPAGGYATSTTSSSSSSAW